LKNKVNRAYFTFVKECLDELAPVKEQEVGIYNGSYSKNLRNGQG